MPVSGIDAAGEGGAGAPRDLILRLGPDYGLFAPYSAMPEMLAMRSLEGSAVPVPRAYWGGDDPSIFGAPFLFCEKMEGAASSPGSRPSEPALEEGYRKRLAEQFIDALGALHRVPWQEKPIAALARGITADERGAPNVEFWDKRIARWAMRPYPLSRVGASAG